MPTPKRSKDQTQSGQRGEATQSGGNKIHGDDLEGIIPGKPEREPQSRPSRDDGDNDDNKKRELK